MVREIDEYQKRTSQTAIFPSEVPDSVPPEVVYCTMGLDGESGEVVEKVKKAWREDDPSYLEDLEDELGDVLWYWAQLCEQLGLDSSRVAQRNLDKLNDRRERGVLTGEGDGR